MVQFSDNATDIDGVFEANPISLDVKTKSNESAIMQHIDLLLMQSEDALIGRPGVCANLRSFLFESNTIAVTAQMKQRIKASLNHEPRIKTNQITIEFEDDYINVNVYFTFVETGNDLIYRSTLRRVL